MPWANVCERCGGIRGMRGVGTIPDPNRRWWELWKRVECPDCGGTGLLKPPPKPVDLPMPPPPAHRGATNEQVVESINALRREIIDQNKRRTRSVNEGRCIHCDEKMPGEPPVDDEWFDPPEGWMTATNQRGWLLYLVCEPCGRKVGAA